MLKIAAILVLVVALATAFWIYYRLQASLPLLEGEFELGGLSHTVTIERDSLGVPTIVGQSRMDITRALGFLHAQDRFFQMDLMRRQAAGELAEVLGEGLLPADRHFRIHRFRARAREASRHWSQEERMVAESYSEGVNAGLAALDAPPFEYLLLRTEPENWLPEDLPLILSFMFLQLHDSRGSGDSARGLVFDLMGPEMFEFLFPLGTEWDAPVVGDAFATPPIPGPEVLDLRSGAPFWTTETTATVTTDEVILGSNNWAAAGGLTSHGGAVLANDMHLPLSVPNIWYRAQLEYPDSTAPDGHRRVTGVTLPGVPFVIAGSNEQVAWGHTNTEGDWVDLVVLESPPTDPNSYLTPAGPQPFATHHEVLTATTGKTETLEVIETIWGPVIDTDHLGRSRALRWIAHDPRFDSSFLDIERATDVHTAIEAANRNWTPPQNFVVADHSGQIGWTVMGPIPRRPGSKTTLPRSWADGSSTWDGWLEPSEYPRVANPPEDRIWTANGRVVDGDVMSVIGERNYALGARARQIRDDLRELENVDESALLAIQLDNEALFLGRWQRLLLTTLASSEASDSDKSFTSLREHTEAWGQKASTDSAGYRAVAEFRRQVADLVLSSLTAICNTADSRFDYSRSIQYEGPLWRIVSERPMHFLDPAFQSWDVLLVAAASRVVASMTADGGSIADATWGARNTSAIRHPLSPALPLLSRWLDMPAVPLPGDSHMPRVQSPSAGASQRMVVSPGREDEAIFHMPTGQSGHPLSPHYRDSHSAWVTGEATPFLPGEVKHRLDLQPDP